MWGSGMASWLPGRAQAGAFPAPTHLLEPPTGAPTHQFFCFVWVQLSSALPVMGAFLAPARRWCSVPVNHALHKASTILVRRAAYEDSACVEATHAQRRAILKVPSQREWGRVGERVLYSRQQTDRGCPGPGRERSGVDIVEQQSIHHYQFSSAAAAGLPSSLDSLLWGRKVHRGPRRPRPS